MEFKEIARKADKLLRKIKYYLGGKQIGLASWVEQERKGTEPTLEHPVSQVVTASQFRSPLYKKWCDEMNEEQSVRRKQWEFVYVMQVLNLKNKIQPGSKGLGFGVGTEPLPAVFAKYGCEILASDQDIESAKTQGWTKSNQHSSDIDMLAHNGILSYEEFSRQVTFEAVDMNAIPAAFHNQYDFVWSCCSLEHLGNIEKGLDFILNSVECLKPGGVAVHTTELNLSSNEETMAYGPTVLFRKKDFESLARRAQGKGYIVTPFNFNPGNEELDKHIDLPPYKFAPHIKLFLSYLTTTSIGVIIERKK